MNIQCYLMNEKNEESGYNIHIYGDVEKEKLLELEGSKNIKQFSLFFTGHNNISAETLCFIDNYIKEKDIVLRLSFNNYTFENNVFKYFENATMLIISYRSLENDTIQKITDSIFQMSKLKYLSLPIFIDVEFKLNLNAIRQLDNLETLSLSANLKEPSLDINTFKYLKKLKNLEIGNIAKNTGKWLQNFSKLEELKTLETLSLYGFSIPTKFDFTNFSNLKRLRLEKCKLKELMINSSSGLVSLELVKCNQINDFSFISDLKMLEKLSLSDLKHIEAIPDLSDLSNFTYLKSQFNKNLINYKALTKISTLKSLIVYSKPGKTREESMLEDQIFEILKRNKLNILQLPINQGKKLEILKEYSNIETPYGEFSTPIIDLYAIHTGVEPMYFSKG